MPAGSPSEAMEVLSSRSPPITYSGASATDDDRTANSPKLLPDDKSSCFRKASSSSQLRQVGKGCVPVSKSCRRLRRRNNRSLCVDELQKIQLMTLRDGAGFVQVASGIGDPAAQAECHASSGLAGCDGFDSFGNFLPAPLEFLLKLPDQCCRLRFVRLLKGPPGG